MWLAHTTSRQRRMAPKLSPALRVDPNTLAAHYQRLCLTLHCPFGDLYCASVQRGLSDASITVASFKYGSASDKRSSLR